MSWNDKLKHTKSQLRNLNKAHPGVSRGFGEMSKAVKESDGPLDFKTKEFIALGIAIATRCETCIVLHIQTLIRAGATREEIADVLAMSIQMGGGPSMMYAAKALECFDEFTDD